MAANIGRRGSAIFAGVLSACAHSGPPAETTAALPLAISQKPEAKELRQAFATGRKAELENAFDLAGQSFRRAIALAEAMQDPVAIALSENLLAGLYVQTGDPSSAVEAYERAMASMERGGVADSLLVAGVLNNLAGAHHALGNADTSENLLRSTIRIYESTVGRKHPDAALNLGNVAVFHLSKGEYLPARMMLGLAMAVLEQAQGRTTPAFVGALNQLAGVHRGLGELDRAKDCLTEAVALAYEILNPRHPQVSHLLYNRALLRISAKEPVAARADLVQALSLVEDVLGKEHPFVAPILLELASLLEASGDPGNVAALRQRAVSIDPRASAGEWQIVWSEWPGPLLDASPSTTTAASR